MNVLQFRVVEKDALRSRVVSDGVELFEQLSLSSATLVKLVDRFVDLQGDVHMGLNDDDLCEIKVSILYILKCVVDTTVSNCVVIPLDKH